MPERGEARESRGLKSKRGNNFYAFVNVNIQRYHQKIHWKRLYNKNKKDKKKGQQEADDAEASKIGFPSC